MIYLWGNFLLLLSVCCLPWQVFKVRLTVLFVACVKFLKAVACLDDAKWDLATLAHQRRFLAAHDARFALRSAAILITQVDGRMQAREAETKSFPFGEELQSIALRRRKL